MSDNIDKARKIFNALKDGKCNLYFSHQEYPSIVDIKKTILGLLESDHNDLSALDPEGKKSKAQMEEELNSAMKNACLKELHSAVNLLKRGSLSLEITKRFVTDCLATAGIDASALYPGNTNSIAQLDAELNSAAETGLKYKYIEEARDNFNRLKSGYTIPSLNALENIYNTLKMASSDASALDPDGKKSKSQMEMELSTAAKTSYTKEARKFFDELKNGTSTFEPEILAGFIRNCFESAQIDASVLDPDGKKDKTQMESELNNAVNYIYIYKARKNFEELLTGKDRTEDVMKSIKDNLEKAKADAAALDPNNEKSKEQMEKELELRELLSKRRHWMLDPRDNNGKPIDPRSISSLKPQTQSLQV